MVGRLKHDVCGQVHQVRPDLPVDQVSGGLNTVAWVRERFRAEISPPLPEPPFRHRHAQLIRWHQFLQCGSPCPPPVSRVDNIASGCTGLLRGLLPSPPVLDPSRRVIADGGEEVRERPASMLRGPAACW